jgi:hypothetical protein
MWLEGLNKYEFKKIACRFYQEWFFKSLADSLPSPQYRNLERSGFSAASLHDLPPIKTLLQILSVQKITDDEIVLKGFNEFFPKVNVQYKKFLLVLEAAQSRIQDRNGENILITDPGTHRIVFS